MAKYIIVPIVEGRGEVDAVPILLRAWLRFRRYRNVEVHPDGPIYAGGKGNIAAAHDRIFGRGVEHYVRLAWLRRPDVILVLLDADEDCPATIAAALLARARTQVAPDCPLGVVVANREYEAWFLAAFPSAPFRQAIEAQGFRLKQRSLPRGMDVEAIADCKARIETLIDLRYRPTIHQPALTRILPFTPGMTRRSRSFRKLLKELHELLMKARRRRLSAERGNSRGGANAPDNSP
jgi:hypothetical protein